MAKLNFLGGSDTSGKDILPPQIKNLTLKAQPVLQEKCVVNGIFDNVPQDQFKYLSDFLVVYKKNEIPANIEDGVSITIKHTETTQVSFSVEIQNAVHNDVYWFRVFPISINGNYQTSIDKNIQTIQLKADYKSNRIFQLIDEDIYQAPTIAEIDAKTYTVIRKTSNPNLNYTEIDGVGDKLFATSGADILEIDFDTLLPIRTHKTNDVCSVAGTKSMLFRVKDFYGRGYIEQLDTSTFAVIKKSDLFTITGSSGGTNKYYNFQCGGTDNYLFTTYRRDAKSGKDQPAYIVKIDPNTFTIVVSAVKVASDNENPYIGGTSNRMFGIGHWYTRQFIEFDTQTLTHIQLIYKAPFDPTTVGGTKSF